MLPAMRFPWRIDCPWLGVMGGLSLLLVVGWLFRHDQVPAVADTRPAGRRRFWIQVERKLPCPLSVLRSILTDWKRDGQRLALMDDNRRLQPPATLLNTPAQMEDGRLRVEWELAMDGVRRRRCVMECELQQSSIDDTIRVVERELDGQHALTAFTLVGQGDGTLVQVRLEMDGDATAWPWWFEQWRFRQRLEPVYVEALSKLESIAQSIMENRLRLTTVA